MDPNANLAEQRRIAAAILQLQDQCSDDGEFRDEQLTTLANYAQRLAELVEALDTWIVGGGFLPARWEQGR